MGDAGRSAVQLATVEQCVEHTLAAVGTRIVLGAPLGLGKPNQLVNAFFHRASQDPSIELTIFTGLSLERPRPEDEIEARLLEPYLARHFGNYCDLEYMRAIRAGSLPPNVHVHEFYFRAGSMVNVGSAQRDYISTNYTFVARDLIDRGVNVVVQLVAEREVDGQPMLSLGGNTDVTLDLISMLQRLRACGRKILAIAQVHRDLPFMYNKALVPPSSFDAIVRNPEYDTTLFATPNLPVSATDFAVGFHASTLIKDGGTLQIGIGALGDAVVYGCQLRQESNDAYRAIAADLGAEEAVIEARGGFGAFEEGLYGCSEMLVNGFLHLKRCGVLKRAVFDEPRLQRLLNYGRIRTAIDANTLSTLVDTGVVAARLTTADVDFLRYWGILKADVRLEGVDLVVGDERIHADLADADAYRRICQNALGKELLHGVIMHGGFFLGPTDMYQTLREMPRAECERIAMDSVRQINRIDNVELHTLQRRHARFINSAMMVTLGGAVVSDGLENGQVVSGVGGQYNFVAQAHELPDAYSIICLRATRGSGRQVASNIVWNYGHCTIPRHLRDVVVTEYGVAMLRGRSDEEIIRALLNVADSRFQEELLEIAKKAGKVNRSYRIPVRYRNNLPEHLGERMNAWRQRGYFPEFPFGSDFTPEELALASSLREIKAMMDEPRVLLRQMIRAFLNNVDERAAAPYLKRIALDHPNTAKEVILRHLLLLELEERGVLKAL
jgi:acyl-CoA hydrolase